VAASSLLKQIQRFELMFLVVIQAKLLEIINTIYNVLQSSDMTLDRTLKLQKHSTDFSGNKTTKSVLVLQCEKQGFLSTQNR
jgi:hypothetical protein